MPSEPAPTRVFATCDLGEAALARVAEAGLDLEVHPDSEPPPHAHILERVVSGVAGLLTTLRDPVDSDVLAAGRGTLRVVAQCAVGLDNVDVRTATRLGIVVTHTPDVLTAATAEFALFALGSLARRLEPSERLVREGRWHGWHPYLPFLGTEVSSSTVGVAGVGRIGRAFAARCVGLEVDLLLHDSAGGAWDLASALQAEMDLRFDRGLSPSRHTADCVDWGELLERSDAISLHVPLITSGPGATHHLVDAAALARMKPGALLVNTSRGPVVDEEALADALRRGHLGGAALDVYETEPLPDDSPLRDPAIRDRLRLFHHFASGTTRTRLSPDPEVGMAGRAVAGLLAVLRPSQGADVGGLPYVANPEVLGGR